MNLKDNNNKDILSKDSSQLKICECSNILTAYLARLITNHTLIGKYRLSVTNFIQPYLHQFFDDSHGLKASLKPLKRPFDRYQSRLEAISIGRDIRQINW